MLYGDKNSQNEILNIVKSYETENHINVIYGAVVGSISKGVERLDSDYDTRFLYLEIDGNGKFKRYDSVLDIREQTIHKIYLPKQKNYFFDKIAFWEITSFINFIDKPVLNQVESNGLYHMVGWTFNSPYIWDPYGIANKINALLDKTFQVKREILYYRDYIINCLSRENVFLREYLYSCFYAIAIKYCIEHKRFPPVYFPTLLAMLDDKDEKEAIENVEKLYYRKSFERIASSNKIVRKMCDKIVVDRIDYIDEYLTKTLEKTNLFLENENSCNDIDGQVEKILNIIFESLDRKSISPI